MTRFALSGLLLFAMLLAGGCASRRGLVSLGNRQAVALLPPSALEGDFLAQQRVDIVRGDARFAFECLFEASPEKTVLVGLSPAGSRIFSLSWDGDQFVVDKLPMVRLPISFREFMAVYQMSFYPEPALAQLGLPFRIEPRSRVFLGSKRPLISCSYAQSSLWQGSVRVYNHMDHYRVEIKTHRVQYF